MNIYVNGSRFTVDHKEAYRELILHDGILISFVNCGGNRLAVYQSSVYEYDLKAPVASYKRSKTRKAFYPAAFVFEAYRNERFCSLFTVYRINSIKRRAVARSGKERCAVLDELYRYLGSNDGKLFYKACNIHSLSGIFLKELISCRKILKQVPYFDGSSGHFRIIIDTLKRAVLVNYFGSFLLAFETGREGYVGACSDRCQRLSSEAHGRERIDIFDRMEL